MPTDQDQRTRSPIEPHPVLESYYRERTERLGFVRGLFNRTAHHYDRINAIFALGSGPWYRAQCLRRAGLRPGMRVLDVAIGTGLVAREAVRLGGHQAEVIGLDLSEAMLAQARRFLPIPLIQGVADALPLADDSVDMITMGYALRHVGDLTATFREFHRVLRPGGSVLVMEIARPERPITRHLMNGYLGLVVPALSRLSGGGEGGRMLMRYYWETIDRCVEPETIKQAMAGAGLEQVRCATDYDLFKNYTGCKRALNGS
ncbi:class I SAM-dependent methyltransferase [Azospirillum picis]|uniref:Demethylmenaquinone methyltransferase/2-methoxy-6-polyprenyl-1,4-benzoquinol methylase n=1 Tax=Azospirillum picis TaxID=488438 RepID=A0ABU0MR50_9PROT|nr:class I SAM-dependent methyltransferase [Azospirillum picis]MBP2302041.1 demethylmenaquinone methyltransferase/2-methoxy-6-polyprenyl-1,4-benzoquinol methylase [Azospirillum picis]MDQ0535668.1 demethylmenaquinone methyltransferase/2-methoxy-6-polyprenyl-1,4-benzoquinol methylase [Azospirillum picis]